MQSTADEKVLQQWFDNVDLVIVARHADKDVPTRAKRVEQTCPDLTKRWSLQCTDLKNLRFALNTQGLTASSTVLDCGRPEAAIAWCDLEKKLYFELENMAIELKKSSLKVVVDLTDADWELGFFVLPALYDLNTSAVPHLQIDCAFTSPDKYPQSNNKKEHAPVITYGIRQPPGWIADLSVNASQAWHVLFLGFDQDRAQKFIVEYNWVLEHCVAVIGDPPYVKDGAEETRSANELLLKQIPNTERNRRSVGAADPNHTLELLNELFAKHGVLDVVLMGTSPMTLGAVWFYLQLTKEERKNVRFLHDFPLRQKGRTTGAKQTWLFSDPFQAKPPSPSVASRRS